MSGSQALREAHAAGIRTYVHIHPAVVPAELIDVVESLRDDVDVWRIGGPPAGEPPPQSIAGERPGLVDADTALAHLRRMVEKGLSITLPNTMEKMNVWFPGKTQSGETEKAEG